MKRLNIGRVATAYLKKDNGHIQMVMVKPKIEDEQGSIYELFIAYENEFLGTILFDAKGYWIYDGNDLSVEESEDIAEFIIQLSNPELFINY